jgi:hypothetical protein
VDSLDASAVTIRGNMNQLAGNITFLGTTVDSASIGVTNLQVALACLFAFLLAGRPSYATLVPTAVVQ